MFAVVIVRLLDPATIVLAAIGGWFSRAWWQVALVAVGVAAVVEIVLFATQLTRVFNPLIFLIGVICAGIWGAIAFRFKSLRNKRRPE